MKPIPRQTNAAGLSLKAVQDDIEAGRIRLATIVLDLAEDGQLGPHEITRTAGRLIRINHFSRSDA